MIDFSRIYEQTLQKDKIDNYQKIFAHFKYDIDSTIDYLTKHKEYDYLDIAPNQIYTTQELSDINNYVYDIYSELIDIIEEKDLLNAFDNADELYEKLKNTSFELAYTTSPILVTSTSAFRKVFLEQRADFDINKRFLGLTVPYKEDGDIQVKVVISYLVDSLPEDKVVATVAHEIAHILDFYINGSLSHGKSWNDCAELIMSLFTKKPIVISETANNYLDELLELHTN